MRQQFPSRLQCAAAFAGVGVIAGAAHVLASDAENLRLWREVLPLASLIGASAGFLFRPSGWRHGALVSVLALPVFAAAYGLAETAILASKGEVSGFMGWAASIGYWTGEVLSQVAIGGFAAAFAGAAAGLWLRRHAKPPPENQAR